jgi:hypothetical protein
MEKDMRYYISAGTFVHKTVALLGYMDRGETGCVAEEAGAFMSEFAYKSIMRSEMKNPKTNCGSWITYFNDASRLKGGVSSLDRKFIILAGSIPNSPL